MLEGVACPVHAGALAVPKGEHPLDGALRIGLHLLGALDGGGRQLLVDGRQEADVVLLQQRPGLPQGLVHHPQGRAAIAADEAGGIEAAGAVAPALLQEQAHQGLGAAEENPAAGAGQVVVELVRAVPVGRGHRSGHFVSSFVAAHVRREKGKFLSLFARHCLKSGKINRQ